ncbi:hypothetical protein F5B17DRAFT_394896, partial [Nemania serpens]
MVPQLWIWRCDRYVLTAFSAGSIPRSFDEYTARESASKTQNRLESMSDHNLAYPDIQVGLLMANQILEFNNRQANGEFPSPLDIFEDRTAQVLTDVDQYMGKSTLSPDDMEAERHLMFRIADIREELVMIQKIFGQQLKILQSYIDDFERSNPDSYNFLNHPPHITKSKKQDRTTTRKWGSGKRPQNAAGKSGKRVGNLTEDEEKEAMSLLEIVRSSRGTIESYQERARKIDKDAEMVEKRMQDQLNLKRTYASIRDARTRVTLGSAVIGFTVITIIFAPLAFVTALFALPIDSLLKNQFVFDGTEGSSGPPSDAAGAPDPTRAYTKRYLGTWFG